jgi:hypothetical protein
MKRLLLLSALSTLWGIGYGYFIVGRWRLDLVGTGFLWGVVWKVVLQAAGVLGPMAAFATAGFYPLRPVEVLLGFVITILAAVGSQRMYRGLARRSARFAGLIGEEGW